MQRGTAACVLGTLPVMRGLEEVFYVVRDQACYVEKGVNLMFDMSFRRQINPFAHATPHAVATASLLGALLQTTHRVLYTDYSSSLTILTGFPQMRHENERHVQSKFKVLSACFSWTFIQAEKCVLEPYRF